MGEHARGRPRRRSCPRRSSPTARSSACSPSRAAPPAAFMRATNAGRRCRTTCCGERDRGVVAGRQQQPVEHALQAHVLAERQHADLRAARCRPPAWSPARVRSGGADCTVSSAVIIFVRLAIAHALVARCAATAPGRCEVEQQAGARRRVEGDVHGVARAAWTIPLSASAGAREREAVGRERRRARRGAAAAACRAVAAAVPAAPPAKPRADAPSASEHATTRPRAAGARRLREARSRRSRRRRASGRAAQRRCCSAHRRHARSGRQ